MFAKMQAPPTGLKYFFGFPDKQWSYKTGEFFRRISSGCEFIIVSIDFKGQRVMHELLSRLSLLCVIPEENRPHRVSPANAKLLLTDSHILRMLCFDIT